MRSFDVTDTELTEVVAMPEETKNEATIERRLTGPTATLTYNLGDQDEERAFRLACRVASLALVIFRLDQRLRNQSKYGEDEKVVTPAAADVVRDWLREEMQDEGLNMGDVE